MSARTTSAVLIVGFLAALVQLSSGLVSTAACVVAGPVLAVLSIAAVRFFEIDLGDTATVLFPTLSSAAGVLSLSLLPAGAREVFWAAPLLAGLVASVFVVARRASAARCALCSRRLGDVAFGCPRCGLRVCDTCWQFEHLRCRVCEQNHVPVFVDPKWWDRELGPRVTVGRCQLCLTPTDTDDTDLRVCRNCGRPQCRACWDAANGECRRCGWTVANLPPALRRYVEPSRLANGGRGAARSAY
jgi:hypothetical protein